MAWEPEVPADPDVRTTLDADGGGATPAEEPHALGMDEGEDARAARTAPRATAGRLALLALNVVLFVACVTMAGADLLWPPVATQHQALPPAQTPASSATAGGTDGHEQPGAPSSNATASPTATGGQARHTPAPTNTALPVSPTATATTAPPTATATPTPTPGSGG